MAERKRGTNFVGGPRVNTYARSASKQTPRASTVKSYDDLLSELATLRMQRDDWKKRARAAERILSKLGFFAGLSPEQQARALAYDGDENHGDPSFKHR